MKIKKLIYGLLGAGGVLVACDKIEEGYMSSNIYYVTDPFTHTMPSPVTSFVIS